MGTKLGVEPKVLYKIIRASSGNSFYASIPEFPITFLRVTSPSRGLPLIF